MGTTNKLLDDQTRNEYQIDVANRFSAIEVLEISIVDNIWDKIRDSLKTTADEKAGTLKIHGNKH